MAGTVVVGVSGVWARTLVSGAIISCALTASARGADGPVVKCPDDESGAHAEYEISPAMRWKSIEPPKSFPRTKSRILRRSFGSFDEERYGFHTVEFVITRHLLPKEVRDTLLKVYGETDGELKVRVKLTGKHGVRWGELSQEYEGSPVGRLADLFVNSKTFASISLATPDVRRPVFRLSYDYTSAGMNSQAYVDVTELLDFRPPQPRALLHLQCKFVEGGGACGAPESLFGEQTSLRCEWDARADDLSCIEGGLSYTGWGTRRGTRRFMAGSGVFSPARTSPVDPRDLAELAELAAKDTEGRSEFVVPEVGAATVLRRIRRPDGDSILIGAPGVGGRMNARLFVVTTRPELPPAIEELVPKGIWEGNGSSHTFEPTGNEAQSSDELARPDNRNPRPTPDARPRFHVTTIFENATLTILQVVVTEGKGRALYWLGLDRANPKVVADALFASSNSSFHVRCGEMARDAVAFSVKLDNESTFRARVNVMPFQRGRMTDARDRSDAADSNVQFACRWRATVEWRPGTGFVTTHQITRCPAPPPLSRMEIAEDGSLKLVPDPEALEPFQESRHPSEDSQGAGEEREPGRR